MKTNTAKVIRFTTTPDLKLVPPSKPCYACEGIGYFQDKVNGNLTLCSCVSDLCNSCGADESEKKIRRKFDSSSNAMHNCKCMNPILKFNRIKALYEKTNIPFKYRLAKVEDLLEEHDNTSSVFNSKDEVREYLKNSPITHTIEKGFYFHGNTGSGKTLLACAILNVLTLKYGIETRYCKVSRDFIQAIKDTFNKKNGWGDPDTDIAAKIEKDLQTVPFLVLDDFGITKDTEWAFEKFYNLIDTRYEYHRPTIITSNKPLEMWKGIFENRIYSRLCEMTKQVFFESLDFRELNKETT